MFLTVKIDRIVHKDQLDEETVLVRDVSFDLPPGDTIGIVGESGSGKSMIAATLISLLPKMIRCEGIVKLDDTDILHLTEAQLRDLRGAKIGMIFQEPMSALNPFMKIGDQIVEGLIDRGVLSQAVARERAVDLLRQVEMPDPEQRVDHYPHQLSGGQRQRVAISIALAADPDILIADEPTTALDVTVQADVLDLIKNIVTSRGMSLLLISHDLGVIAKMCRRTLVMCRGEQMEYGETTRVLRNPQSDYTRSLLDALPSAAQRDASASAASLKTPVLQLANVTQEYVTGKNRVLRAVDDVSLTIYPGEIVGLVGESGCGKSTLARMIMGLAAPKSGQVLFENKDIYAQSRKELRLMRQGFQMVFQDPRGSLDPQMTIEKIISEPVGLMQQRFSRAQRREMIAGLLHKVGLDENAIDRYPSQFSGGQRQRIAIARALVCKPKLILADEPTSALDMTVQAQILDLLRRLRKEEGLTILLITHSLSVVESLCDRTVVMQKGRFVEEAETDAIFASPRTNYTRRLLGSEYRL